MPPPAAETTWKLLATGEEFVDVWGSSSTEVFVLGAGGTILHCDGSRWDAFSAPPSSWGAIWGTSPQNIFIADLRAIHHYDGVEWAHLLSGYDGSLRDIWGTSEGDIFAVGTTAGSVGAILHGHGSTWTETRTETAGLYAIWGSSSRDVFAVGDDGAVLHYDGTTWTRMSSGTASTLFAVWGSSSSDVYAAGLGALLHYDGAEWKRVNVIRDLTWMWGVWGTSSTDVYIVGSSLLDSVTLRRAGLILHFDGANWTRLPTWTVVEEASDLYAVWGSSSTNVYAVGGGSMDRFEQGSVILHDDGTGWRSEATNLLHESWTELAGVGGSSSTDVYFVGHWRDVYPSYRHFDGTQFGPNNYRTTALVGWSDVWAVARDAVFVVRRDGREVGRFDGTEWTYWGLPGAESASVWGYSTKKAFVVGGSGRIYSFDGSNWSFMRSGTTRHFYDVWGISEQDVFAVGEAGMICHYDGFGWSLMPTETDDHLHGVWGSSGGDVFAVGNGGTILHYDGSRWSSMSNPMPSDLSGVWGSSPTSVFAVGEDVVLHYDGKAWSTMSEVIGGTDVWGSSSTDVYLVDRSRIFRYGPR